MNTMLKTSLVASIISFGMIGHTAAEALPSFEYSHLIVSPANMSYNPTKELIFPCLVKVDDHITNPLGKYYLYFAPHDAPGGVCMAYADAIEGPYTEYDANPVLSKTHQGKISVSHVSSPYVKWDAQYKKFIMYFHGENSTTRWAYSTDGVSWSLADDNICVTSKQFGSDFTECSYAKVYEYAIPGIGDPYTMVMMLISDKTGSGLGGGRRIGLATSSDGKVFTPRDTALVSPVTEEGANVSGPAYWTFNNKHYIFYHASSGNIHYTEVGAKFDQENHLGVFYDPSESAPELDKAADCFMVHEDSVWHMIYTVGTRLDQSIAYARQKLSTALDAKDCVSPLLSRSGRYSVSAGRGHLAVHARSDASNASYAVALYAVDGRLVFKSGTVRGGEGGLVMTGIDLPRGAYMCTLQVAGGVTEFLKVNFDE